MSEGPQDVDEPSPMPVARPTVVVTDVPSRGRFEARLGPGGELAAFLDYRSSRSWVALLHTEVLEGYEGLGIGSQLVDGVFAQLRDRGRQVIPRCPFVVRWLERHPDEHDILMRPLHGPAPPSSPTPLEPA
jgi:hypothetical protein